MSIRIGLLIGHLPKTVPVAVWDEGQAQLQSCTAVRTWGLHSYQRVGEREERVPEEAGQSPSPCADGTGETILPGGPALGIRFSGACCVLPS